MKNSLPTYAHYRREYETAKELGAAALACNAVLVPDGFEHLRLLITNFQKPIATNNDAADVDYAGGLAAHVSGVPKTSFESSLTILETEKNTVGDFAQAMADNGGFLDAAHVFFGISDGFASAVTDYRIFDITITFSDGGGEIDSASRSQVLTVNGSIRYMYFGQNADLGAAGASAFDQINNTLKARGGKTNAINAAVGGLIGLAQGGVFNQTGIGNINGYTGRI